MAFVKDMDAELPNSRLRLIFRLPNVGWVRGWFGDSWFEGYGYAQGMSAYDVRIINNITGEIRYEREAQTALRPVGSDS